MGLTCPGFGSSCFIGHHKGAFTEVETWQWKRRLLVLLGHYIGCFSAMCRDYFHCSLTNYYGVIMVIGYVWMRGAVLK